MLATFFIEIALAIYTVARYKLTPITRLAAALLVCLAIFQLAEYNICEGAWGVDSLTWARIGHVAITLLPPMGLHLATRIAGKPKRLLVGVAYVSAVIFSFIFLFIGHGIQSEECLGNYVIFNAAPWVPLPYTIYYYGLLAMTVSYALTVGGTMKKKNLRHALYFLAAGYMAFIVPTTAANLIDPSTIAGIPSIMCGFAVILAVILATVVVPKYYKR